MFQFKLISWDTTPVTMSIDRTANGEFSDPVAPTPVPVMPAWLALLMHGLAVVGAASLQRCVD